MEDTNLYIILVGVWGMMATFSFWIDRNVSIENKRKWRIIFSLANGGVFIIFSQLFAPGIYSLLFVTAGVAFYTWMNVKFTKFCPSCGHAMNSLQKISTCPACGKILDIPGRGEEKGKKG